MEYKFTLQLIDQSEITSEMEKRIFLSGCYDALLHSSNNQVYLTFARCAYSYYDAVYSAQTNLSRAGYRSVLC
jgi:hypothetical protein